MCPRHAQKLQPLFDSSAISGNQQPLKTHSQVTKSIIYAHMCTLVFSREGYSDVSRTSFKKSCNQPLVKYMKYSGSEKFLCPFQQNTHYALRRVFLGPR